MIAAMLGWLDQRQQDTVAYLIQENRILRKQEQGRRLKLSDDDRRRNVHQFDGARAGTGAGHRRQLTEIVNGMNAIIRQFANSVPMDCVGASWPTPQAAPTFTYVVKCDHAWNHRHIVAGRDQCDQCCEDGSAVRRRSDLETEHAENQVDARRLLAQPT
jgi:hypothetical protein